MRRLMLIALLLATGAGPPSAREAGAADTPASWGKIKQLYAGGVRVVPGSGVDAATAEEAHRTALEYDRSGLTGPVAVRMVTGSRHGTLLMVLGRGGRGSHVAHLVTGRGRHVGGVEIDPVSGVFRDARTGVPFWREDFDGELDPAGVEEILDRIVSRAGSMACAMLAGAVVQKCLLPAAIAAGLPGAISCVAAGAAILTACELLREVFYRLIPEPGEEPWQPVPGHTGAPPDSGD